MRRAAGVLLPLPAVLVFAAVATVNVAYAQRPEADREPPTAQSDRATDRASEPDDDEAAPASDLQSDLQDVRDRLQDLNEQQQPIVDSIRLYGGFRTDSDHVARFLGVTPGRLLTKDQFLRASRRLDQLALSSKSRVRYVPIEDQPGRVHVEIDVQERDVFPTSVVALGTIAVRGIASQKFDFDISSPTGHGEALETSLRLEPDWQRLELGFHWPLAARLSGLASVTALFESQLFEPAPGFGAELGRRSIGVGVSSWASSWLWWEGGVAADRLADRSYVATTGGVGTRFLDDRLAGEVTVGRWTGGEHPSFSRAIARLSARTTRFRSVPVWRGMIGAAAVGDAAPLQTWVGTGSQSVGDAYLRAHPLVRNGAVKGEAFGRRLVFATAEYERPLWHSKVGPLSWAGFVDSARAWERAAGLGASPFHVDVGVSFRLYPAMLSNAIRLDIARGLRDGQMHISLGLTRDWPD
jgi:hypothetical protein